MNKGCAQRSPCGRVGDVAGAIRRIYALEGIRHEVVSADEAEDVDAIVFVEDAQYLAQGAPGSRCR